MNVKEMMKAAVMVGLVGGFALASTGPADAGKVRWKMQSAFGSSLPHLGTSAVRFVDNVKVMSGGDLNIKFFEPGALVPSLECFDAVSKGSLQSCWTTPGYHVAKYPALSFFTTVPFGPQIGEFLGWKWFGGGNELKQEIYDKHNLIAFDSFAIGAETSGWFKTEITSLDQIKGLKMRFFGLGAKVMEKMGVQTQLLPGADIYPALERGVIDATEFSMPSIDKNLGFYQIAKHNYFPGWHQQSSVGELLMNKAKWNTLSKQHQAIIKASCDATIAWSLIRSDAIQADAMKWMEKEGGVTLHDWSPEFLAKFKAGWDAVVAEELEKDPLFAETYKSYTAFRKKYAVWGDRAYLK